MSVLSPTNVLAYLYTSIQTTNAFNPAIPSGIYVTWSYTGTATFTITPYINNIAQTSLITTSSTTNKIFTNLTVNTSYTFRVSATSGGITSELSSPSNEKFYTQRVHYSNGKLLGIPYINDTPIDVVVESRIYMLNAFFDITSFDQSLSIGQKMTSLVLPDTMTGSTPAGFCNGQTLMTYIRWSKNFTYINYNFHNGGLIEIDLSYTAVTGIENWAFNTMPNLRKIMLPPGVTGFGPQSFIEAGTMLNNALNQSTPLDVYFFSPSIPLLANNIFTGPQYTFPNPCRAFYLPGTTNVSRIDNHVNTSRNNQAIFTSKSVFLPTPTNISVNLFQTVDDSFPTGILVSWDSVYTASKYLINIYTSSTSTTPVKVISSSGTGKSYTITSTDNLDSGTYFFGVQSRSDSDNVSSTESNRSSSVIFDLSFKYKILDSSNAFVNGSIQNLTTISVIPTSIIINSTSYKITKIGDNCFKNLNSLTTVSIPSHIFSLGISSFENCINLTFITFPSTLISIGNNCFRGCVGLTSVSLPSSLTSLGSSAFQNCSNLSTIQSLQSTILTSIQESTFDNTAITSISLPNNVSSINVTAFLNCYALESLVISSTNSNFTTENGILFNKAKTSLLFYPKNIINFSYELPSTLLSLGDYSFYDSSGMLTDLYFNSSIQTVGKYVFNNNNLNMTFFYTVPTFDQLSFSKTANIAYKLSTTTNVNNLLTQNFSEIKTITAPYNIKLIPYIQNVGSDVSGIYISWTNSTNLISVLTISLYLSTGTNPVNTFNVPNPSDLTSYVINSGLSINQIYKIKISITISTGQILTSDFSSTLYYTNEISYNISNNNGIISGFKGTPSQVNLNSEIRIGTIIYNIITIGTNAFRNCLSLTSIILPSTITNIESFAFENCTGLTAFSFPSSLLYIKKGAFKSCSGLLSITIPASIFLISEETFMNCSGLTSINLPNSISRIYTNAFTGCSNITSFTIPNSLSDIEPKIFYNCNNLASFVVSIDNSKFSAVDGIMFNKTGTKLILFPMGKNVTTYSIPNNITEIGNYAFQQCNKITSITLNSVTRVGVDAFNNCIFTSISIPDSLTDIDEGAFSYCYNLTSFTVNSSHTVYSTVDGILFSKNSKKIIFYPVGKTQTSYIIPPSVEEIGPTAFQSSLNLTSISLPNTLKVIGNSAFRNCINIPTISIPSTITSIGSNAFADNPGLRIIFLSSTPLVFNLPSLNIVISSDLVKLIDDDGVNLTGDVIVNVEISASIINNTFIFKTITPGSIDLTTALYKVNSNQNNYDDVIPKTETSTITYDNGITSGYIGPNDITTTLPYEYLCYISHIKNNTTNGIRGILQVSSFLTNMNTKIDNTFKAVLQGLSNIEQAYSDSVDIISLSLLKEISINDNSRLLNVQGTSLGNNWYPNLVQPGDYLYYTVTIEPHPLQTGITNNRVYLFKAKVI